MSFILVREADSIKRGVAVICPPIIGHTHRTSMPQPALHEGSSGGGWSESASLGRTTTRTLHSIAAYVRGVGILSRDDGKGKNEG